MTSLALDGIEPLDFDTLDSLTIELTSAQLQAASGGNWTEYLENLAQFGLEAWWSEQNLAATGGDGNRWVSNGFQVQGLMVSASEEDVVYAKLETPAAHFYVLTQVSEEQGQVKVSGFIRSEMFQALIQSCDCIDGEYELPIDAFDHNPATLLLALRCVEPSVVSLPTVAPSLGDRVVNLGRWFQGQFAQGLNTGFGQGLNTVSDALNWTPMQPVGVRSELPQILQSLARQGIRLADNAQGASQVITVSQIPLRLYVVTGEVVSDEWEMLVVLESATAELMPTGITLRMSDDREVLVEQRFDPQTTTDRSIFAEVVSGMNESVLVEIVLPNGAVHALPRFVFS
jgi:Protein of unknown function (DUF1822)